MRDDRAARSATRGLDLACQFTNVLTCKDQHFIFRTSSDRVSFTGSNGHERSFFVVSQPSRERSSTEQVGLGTPRALATVAEFTGLARAIVSEMHSDKKSAVLGGMIQLRRAAGENDSPIARELCIDRKTLRRGLVRFFALEAMLVAFPTISSDVPEVARIKADEKTIIEELKAPQDPTILKRRIWLDAEWNSFKNASDDVELTVAKLWAWPLSASQDWAVRLKVPVKLHHAGDAVGDSSERGLGDIKLAAGTAVRFSDSLRAAYGLEMRFPTAPDKLGANVWQPQLFVAAAWDATPRITLSPSAEYNKSIAEQHGAARQHFLEIFFPVTFVLPGSWSVAPSYELKVDFANNSQVIRSVKLQVSKRHGSMPSGFSLSIKKTIDETDKRFQINFVTTYFFR